VSGEALAAMVWSDWRAAVEAVEGKGSEFSKFVVNGCAVKVT
jgi:hypothetical protein